MYATSLVPACDPTGKNVNNDSCITALYNALLHGVVSEITKQQSVEQI